MLRFSRLFRLYGVTYRAHWSLALLLLVVPAFPLGVPLYLALVLAHEHGHGFFVRRCGGVVESIDLHFLGGLCRYRGSMGPRESAIIAWGGIIAQLVILFLAGPPLLSTEVEGDPVKMQVFGVLVGLNTMSIMTNLLPIPSLDGWQAWRLLPMWWKDRAGAAKTRPVAKRKREVKGTVVDFEQERARRNDVQ